MKTIKPLIFWEGFPPCGLLTKQVAQLYGDDLKLLGTKATVPFKGLEQLLGRSIDWMENPNDIWDRREEFADRNLIVHTGWAHPGWLKFDRWIKKRGAKVVVAVDNNWKGTLRQYLGSIWFRLWLKRHFDAALVPGRSASELMQFLGMPANRIFTGYYGAYEHMYKPGKRLKDRRSEFLFVGQLIHRKGVDILLEAYKKYRSNGGVWDLRILGSGPFEKDCKGDGIVFEGFGQVDLVSLRMQEARCLILPSREDHWGTVVCEAMASGMPVIASRWVGASEDLIRNGMNGYIFEDMTSGSLERCMQSVSQWSTNVLDNAEQTSIGVAAGYTSGGYLASHSAIVESIF
jgi:glycosyltransferase involved in cell wall biosynthesis